MSVGDHPIGKMSATSRRNFLRNAILGVSGASAATMMGTWSVEAGEKVLTVAIPSNPVTFDPINAANHDAMVVSQTIFENLVQVDIEGKRFSRSLR
jgi:peptide/nickel transport system substrate-binding protein